MDPLNAIRRSTHCSDFSFRTMKLHSRFFRSLPNNDDIPSNEQKHPRNSRITISFKLISAAISLTGILVLLISSLNFLRAAGSDYACGEGFLEIEFMSFKYKLKRQFDCADQVDHEVFKKPK